MLKNQHSLFFCYYAREQLAKFENIVTIKDNARLIIDL